MFKFISCYQSLGWIAGQLIGQNESQQIQFRFRYLDKSTGGAQLSGKKSKSVFNFLTKKDAFLDGLFYLYESKKNLIKS